MNQGLTDNPRTFLETHLDVVERAVTWASRRNGFSPEDAEELRSIVFLRLIEDDYRVLRSFRGKSHVSTYLTTVAYRLALDYRIAKWGKWRPSRAARRLGDQAVELEALITRDGYSTDEAIATLVGRSPALSPAALEALAASLPVRSGCRFESLEDVPELAAPDCADELLQRSEQAQRKASVYEVYGRLRRTLPEEDQTILRLRFERRLTIRKVAIRLGLDPKVLYRRLPRLLRHLRGLFEAEGVNREAVLEAVRPLSGNIGER